jgi:hypothetical protein
MKSSACPFCYSDDTVCIEIDAGQWTVSCNQCQASGPTMPNRFDAVRAWQRVAPIKREAPSKAFFNRILGKKSVGEL